MKTFYLLAVLACISSVSRAQPQASPQLRVIEDLLYVEASQTQHDSLQRLNLVLPAQSENSPLLVWIGGGAWSYVDRDMEMDLARKVASEGIAVAAVGHRLSSATWHDPGLTEGVRHPAHVKDVAAAFRWLHDNASKYGIDDTSIFVGGYSSGGHLAVLLSLDARYLEEHGLSPDNIKGVIPIAGTYDISDYHSVFLNSESSESRDMADSHVKAVFGKTESDFVDASPTSYVEEISVPMLLVSESNTYNYTKIFEEKVRETGFQEFDVLHVLSMGHGEFWQHLSHDEASMYRGLITEFIKRQ